MRYVNLSTILVYRLVSEKVMDRFPDYDSLVQAKLMLPNEVKRLQKVDDRTPHESTWTPILWAMKLLTLGRYYLYIILDWLCLLEYQPICPASITKQSKF